MDMLKTVTVYRTDFLEREFKERRDNKVGWDKIPWQSKFIFGLEIDAEETNDKKVNGMNIAPAKQRRSQRIAVS